MSTSGDVQYIGGKNKLTTEFNDCFGIEIIVSFRTDCRNWLSSNAAQNGNSYL